MMEQTKKKQLDFIDEVFTNMKEMGLSVSPLSIAMSIDYMKSNDTTKLFIDINRQLENVSTRYDNLGGSVSKATLRMEVLKEAIQLLYDAQDQFTPDQRNNFISWLSEVDRFTDSIDYSAKAQGTIKSMKGLSTITSEWNRRFWDAAENSDRLRESIMAMNTATMTPAEFPMFEQLKSELDGIDNYLLTTVTKTQEAMQMKLETLRSVFEIMNNLMSRSLNKLEDKYNKDMELAKDNAAKREEIEEEYDKKRRKLLFRQAMLQKALAVFEISLATYKAVMEYASKVYTAPLVPWALALGAAQIGAVMATPIPEMANGGVIPPGYPNDTYPAWLSSGERVLPPGELDSTEFGSKKLNITVKVEGVTKGTDIHYIVKEVQRQYENTYN